MGKHRHGKRRKLSCAEQETGSAVHSLPTWLEAATRHVDAASPSPTHVWPARLDRVLTEPLRRALASEGFSACTDLAPLLPQELIELDTTLSLHTAESIVQITAKITQGILDGAEEPTIDFCVVENGVAICKLQPIQLRLPFLRQNKVPYP